MITYSSDEARRDAPVEQRLADIEQRVAAIENAIRAARRERVAAIGRIAADCAGVKRQVWRPKAHHILAAVTIAVVSVALLDFLLRAPR